MESPASSDESSDRYGLFPANFCMFSMSLPANKKGKALGLMHTLLNCATKERQGRTNQQPTKRGGIPRPAGLSRNRWWTPKDPDTATSTHSNYIFRCTALKTTAEEQLAQTPLPIFSSFVLQFLSPSPTHSLLLLVSSNVHRNPGPIFPFCVRRQ